MVIRFFKLLKEGGYDEKVLFVCFWAYFFFTPQATAQNKVVVLPLMGDEATECITCKGKLVGNRWCDQANGTVMDMTTGLVWLKKADWAGVKPWRNPSADCSAPNYECYDDAHTRVGLLRAGAIGVNLSYVSVLCDWRLPTIS